MAIFNSYVWHNQRVFCIRSGGPMIPWWLAMGHAESHPHGGNAAGPSVPRFQHGDRALHLSTLPLQRKCGPMNVQCNLLALLALLGLLGTLFKHKITSGDPSKILKADRDFSILCLLQEFGAHAKGYHKEFLGASETSIFSNSGGTDRTAFLTATISWILQCHHRYHFIPFHDISEGSLTSYILCILQRSRQRALKNQSSGETDSAGLRRDRSPEALESRLKPRQLPLQLSPVNFVNWADLVWYLYNKPCGIENSPKQTQLLTNWQCSSSSYSSEAS